MTTIMLTISFMILSGILCLYLGIAQTSKIWQKTLVEKGLAEYYLDEKFKKRWRLIVDREKECDL